MNVGILGAGNMGGAIARGYARSLAETEGSVKVFIYDVDTSKAEAIAKLPGIEAASDEADLLAKSDAVVFAIKPQMFDEVVPWIAALPGAASGDKLFISIAAGVSIDWLVRVLGDGAKVVRVMPNTPAMVGEGMSALARSASVTDAEFDEVARVFGAIGRVAKVTEDQLDAVTGISGSSPAYAYLYMQALVESGVRHGLSEEDARLFAAQSTLGAAKMVVENGDVSIEQLRINVCSPGGATIEAVKVLEKEGFTDTIKRAIYACVEKSKRMKM
ncbi:MAG: pyrroline-5-carboxylate reductase [Clostridiales Family XIII bacterium]|jgi:pyrroline-5-carboxylate reductase|nr:pyrroline-5-carboxylate reductase [Clostridiales Family XIII bacterium]